MKRFFLSFLFLLSFFTNEAYTTTYYYHVREGDRLLNILNAYYQTTYSGNEIDAINIDVKAFTLNLKKINPQIKDWQNLKSGTTIIMPDPNQGKKLSIGFFIRLHKASFLNV